MYCSLRRKKGRLETVGVTTTCHMSYFGSCSEHSGLAQWRIDRIDNMKHRGLAQFMNAIRAPLAHGFLFMRN